MDLNALLGPLLGPLGLGLATSLGFMAIIWLVSLPTRNSSIVDIAWGPGFALQAAVYFAATGGDGFAGFEPRRLLVLALVIAWAGRLALHVAVRNVGKGEDYRYATWRRNAGASWWWRSLLQVFVLQGVLSWLVGVPLLAALVGGAAGWTLLDGLAVAAWAIGFVFEAGGDWQLRRFLADSANRGRTLRSGLWRYSRHPNYFGDVAQWWGMFGLAAAAGGWWTVGSPLLMTWLIVRVSGVGMLERTIAERRPDYAEYMRTTSAFLPWFPKDA